MKIITFKNNNIQELLILKNKTKNTYSFVNLSKMHICPCEFDSINSAIKDLENYIKNGKIDKYKIIN